AEDRAPKIIGPIHNENFLRDEESRSQPIRLEWEQQLAQGYFIEIYRGDEQVRQSEIKQTSVRFAPASFGTYRWRVKVQDARRPNSPWSEFYQFNVSSDSAPPQLELINPKSNDQIAVGKNFERPTEFRWSGDETLTYLLEV